MNYEDLTKRISRAQDDQKKGHDYWTGYIAALLHVRGAIERNVGGEK